MEREMTRLQENDIKKLLKLTTSDEAPDGYRDEIYVEKLNGKAIDNWFVGSKGAISYSTRTILSPEDWNNTLVILKNPNSKG